MKGTGNIYPSYYNGFYRHGVDEKRRLQVPSKWRPREAGVEFTLMVWPQSSLGPCLRVLPPEQMARLMEDIRGLPNGDPKKVVLMRFIGSQSEQALVDRAGRICLPREMAESVGVENEAVLVGLLDRFEIWSPERYEKVQAADAVMAEEAFALMR